MKVNFRIKGEWKWTLIKYLKNTYQILLSEALLLVHSLSELVLLVGKSEEDLVGNREWFIFTS